MVAVPAASLPGNQKMGSDLVRREGGFAAGSPSHHRDKMKMPITMVVPHATPWKCVRVGGCGLVFCAEKIWLVGGGKGNIKQCPLPKRMNDRKNGMKKEREKNTFVLGFFVGRTHSSGMCVRDKWRWH